MVITSLCIQTSQWIGLFPLEPMDRNVGEHSLYFIAEWQPLKLSCRLNLSPQTPWIHFLARFVLSLPQERTPRPPWMHSHQTTAEYNTNRQRDISHIQYDGKILPFRSQEILYFYLNFRNITLIFNLLPFFATENSARIYNHCIAATIISNIISMSHICKAIDGQA